ncbi:MAG TPA: hypothetical protein VEU33_38615, partial [Archangium sp.]|nr:hypothetical protein [Archangium sp.]
LGDGAVLELARGCQGSQHVVVSLRAWELTSLTARVTLSLERVEDGRVVSSPFALRLPFEAGASPEAPATLEGLLLVVPEPASSLGREVRLTASLETEASERATATRSATLQWGTGTCPQVAQPLEPRRTQEPPPWRSTPSSSLPSHGSACAAAGC